MAESRHSNPFRVFSPEGMPPNDFHDIFVADVPGGTAIKSEGHTWLHGPRGSGKSMLLRYLEPDCQLIELSHTNGLSEPDLARLSFFALYASARQFESDFPEMARLRGDFSEAILAEHALVLHFVYHALSRLKRSGALRQIESLEMDQLQTKLFVKVHAQVAATKTEITSIKIGDALGELLDGLWEAQLTFNDYLDRLLVASDRAFFESKVLRQKTFLEPLTDWLLSLPAISQIRHIFIILDDADKLTEAQTRVFNTWLSRRSGKVSYKFSSEEYQYKTFYTKGDFRVEHPHDFNELNLTDIYTSNQSRQFRERMYKIVNKRLSRLADGKDPLGRQLNAIDFFQEDSKQEREIAEIATSLTKGTTRSTRGRDDAYRYARPNYMLSLAGNSKNKNVYSYSGFEQLVNISSGNPRYFLEFAHEMFDRQVVRHSRQGVPLRIEPEVQNAVVREKAQDLFLEELDELKLDGTNRNRDYKAAIYLQQFIGSLGMLFESILYNPALSERRVFSFAVSDVLDEEVEKVLRLGVTHAYFSRTAIGRKEGMGKTECFVLSRRFAPYFKLDPNGFTAYKFLQNSEIRRMMFEPEAYRKALRAAKSSSETTQMTLGFWD